MASKHTTPLLDIDLNAEFAQPEIDNENPQLQNTNETHPILPNININAEESFVIDLNIIPNSPTIDQFSFDLNIQPFVNSDINFNENTSRHTST